MIDARELRIGNLVKSQFDGIVRIGIHELFQIENNATVKVEGIPLTEEWLVKFGWQIKNDFINDFYWKLGWLIEKDDNNDLFIVKGDKIILKYVHQLQNLYFALTGEELTIK